MMVFIALRKCYDNDNSMLRNGRCACSALVECHYSFLTTMVSYVIVTAGIVRLNSEILKSRPPMMSRLGNTRAMNVPLRQQVPASSERRAAVGWGRCASRSSSNTQQTDMDLLRLAAAGDAEATEALLARYRYLVESKARNYFLIGADHDDVVQEGMIGLYKAIRDYRIDRASCFRSFADLCVTRQIISAVKMATRNKHLPLNAYISLYRSPGSDAESDMRLVDCLADALVPSPYDMLFERKGAVGRLEAAREALSRLEQSVLECYLQGKSYREMAVELRRSSKTIDNALQRVKRKLFLSLSPHS